LEETEFAVLDRHGWRRTVGVWLNVSSWMRDKSRVLCVFVCLISLTVRTTYLGFTKCHLLDGATLLLCAETAGNIRG